MTYDMDMEYARQEAAADKARDRAWKNLMHGGPEFWEDWMGYCQSCFCEECECPVEACPTCHGEDVEWEIGFFDTDRTEPVPADADWAHCNKCDLNFTY